MSNDPFAIQNKLESLFNKYQRELLAVYLFGSMADGSSSPGSDIDIAVLLSLSDRKRALELKLQLYADLCRHLQRNDVDLVILNLSTNLILKDQILKHGQLLFTSDDQAREDYELKVLHQCMDFKLHRQQIMAT